MADKDIKKALKIAKKVHKGQIYGIGDYFKLHIMPIYNMAKTLTSNKEIIITAIMHDVLEDGGDQTLADIFCSRKISEAIKAISRRRTETYKEYIERVSKNHIASAVKYIDLLENLSNIPNSGWEDSRKEMMFKRYTNALVVIGPIVIKGDL